MTANRPSAWEGSWRNRLRDRLRSFGCATVSELLEQHPGVPYLEIARRLGEDVAPVQLEWTQMEEARRSNAIRQAAMDSLARDIRGHLSDGWKASSSDDSQTVLAIVWWMIRLEQADSGTRPKAEAVWEALKGSCPPVGWKPTGCTDKILLGAFDKAWPPN
jgi:hypothetical protein